MGRRSKERSGGKGKKEREPASPREVIHRRAYWFDRARSLSELHGWAPTEAGDGQGLVGRYRAAIHRPIGELSSAELHTLLTQGTDPHFLAPVALERLRGPLGLDERALLGDVLRLPRAFWRLRPFLEAELRELAAAILATLGEDADEPSALARELTRLLERA